MEINAISSIGFQRKNKSEEKLEKLDRVLDKIEQSDSFDKVIADDEVLDGIGSTVRKMSDSENKHVSKFANGLMIGTIGLGSAYASFRLGRNVVGKGINVLGKRGESLMDSATKGLNFLKEHVNGLNSETKAAKKVKNIAGKVEDFVQNSTNRNEELGKYAEKLKKPVEALSEEELAEFNSTVLGRQTTKNFISSVTGGVIGAGVGINTTVNVAKDNDQDGIPDKFQQTLRNASGMIIGV